MQPQKGTNQFVVQPTFDSIVRKALSENGMSDRADTILGLLSDAAVTRTEVAMKLDDDDWDDIGVKVGERVVLQNAFAVQMQPSSTFAVQAQPVQLIEEAQLLYPMEQTNDLPLETFKISMKIDKWPYEKEKRTWGSSMLLPLQKRGVTPQEWDIVVGKLQRVYEATPFVPCCGGGKFGLCVQCCFHCFPGGPIQYFCCVCYCAHCLYGSRDGIVTEAREVLKPILEKRSVELYIHFIGTYNVCAEFQCRAGRFPQLMQQPQIQMQQPQQYVVVR